MGLKGCFFGLLFCFVSTICLLLLSFFIYDIQIWPLLVFWQKHNEQNFSGFWWLCLQSVLHYIWNSIYNEKNPFGTNGKLIFVFKVFGGHLLWALFKTGIGEGRIMGAFTKKHGHLSDLL